MELILRFLRNVVFATLGFGMFLLAIVLLATDHFVSGFLAFICWVATGLTYIES